MSDKHRSAIRMHVRNEFSKSKTTEMLLNAYGEKRHELKKKKKKKKQQSTCGINALKRAATYQDSL